MVPFIEEVQILVCFGAIRKGQPESWGYLLRVNQLSAMASELSMSLFDEFSKSSECRDRMLQSTSAVDEVRRNDY